MIGRQSGDQTNLFYEFWLDDRIPKDHLLRRIEGFVAPILGEVREQLKSYYSKIGRPSVDPELMIRMLIVGYCYGLRSERRLTQEVELHLAYRWFCRLDLDDKIPHHSTFSENRLHRFRESDVFRHIFERVVAACMAAGLVKGEGFAVDASVMEANASRYHGKAPDEIEWALPERRTRAVKEYLAALEAEIEPNPDRQPPKVISPSDPCSAWTRKPMSGFSSAMGSIISSTSRTRSLLTLSQRQRAPMDEVEGTKTMLDRTERRLRLKPSGSPQIRLTGRAVFWAGWSVAGSHRISRSAMPASATTVPSLAVTFAGTGAEAFTSAPTTRCCIPPAPCRSHLVTLSRFKVRLRCLSV